MLEGAVETLEQTSDMTSHDTLLRLVFVPWLTEEMAQQLSGLRNVQPLLGWLDKQRLCDRDAAAGVVRYTWAPEAREMLYCRARLEFLPEHFDALKTLSVSLLERQGFVCEAVRVLFDANQWADGLALLARRVYSSPVHVGMPAIVKLIQLVPDDVQAREPRFWHLRGVALVGNNVRGALLAFSRGLELVEYDMSSQDGALECLGEAMAACALTFRLPSKAAQHAWKVLRRPSRESAARFAMNLALLYGSWFQTVPSLALARSLLELEHAAPQTDSPRLRILAAIGVVLHFTVSGALARARSLIDKIESRDFYDGIPLTLRIWWQLALACYRLASGELAQIDPLLEQVDARLGESGFSCLRSCVAILRCYAALAADDVGGAVQWLERGDEVPTFIHAFSLLARSCIALRQDRIGDAYAHIQHALRVFPRGWPKIEFYARLTYAHVLQRNADLSAARQVLAGLREHVGRQADTLFDYQLLLHEALMEQACIRSRRPHALLDQALRLARRREFLPIPLHWSRQEFADLCLTAIEEDVSHGYVETLVARYQLPPPRAQSTQAWPWPIKIYTLGPFRLLKDGKSIEYPGKAQRRPLELLKAIVALGGKSVDTPVIASMLWPDSESEAALCAFDITLHRLRKLLGHDDAIQISDKKVSLSSQIVWFDTQEFSRHVNVGLDMITRAQEIPVGPELVEFARRVLTLYQGDFLTLEVAHPWIMMARDKLRSQWLRFVLGVGHALMQRKEMEVAIELYQRCIESDPLAEDVYLQLIQCYQKTGRYAEAIGVYRRCREMFSILLGIAPSECTTAVYRACFVGSNGS